MLPIFQPSYTPRMPCTYPHVLQVDDDVEKLGREPEEGGGITLDTGCRHGFLSDAAKPLLANDLQILLLHTQGEKINLMNYCTAETHTSFHSTCYSATLQCVLCKKLLDKWKCNNLRTTCSFGNSMWLMYESASIEHGSNISSGTLTK